MNGYELPISLNLVGYYKEERERKKKRLNLGNLPFCSKVFNQLLSRVDRIKLNKYVQKTSAWLMIKSSGKENSNYLGQWLLIWSMLVYMLPRKGIKHMHP